MKRAISVTLTILFFLILTSCGELLTAVSEKELYPSQAPSQQTLFEDDLSTPKPLTPNLPENNIVETPTQGLFEYDKVIIPDMIPAESSSVEFDWNLELETEFFSIYPSQFLKIDESHNSYIRMNIPTLEILGSDEGGEYVVVNDIFNDYLMGRYYSNIDFNECYNEGIDISYAVTYADENIISVFFYGYTGGGRNKYGEGITIDLKKEKVVSLPEVLPSFQEITKKITNHDFRTYHHLFGSLDELDEYPDDFTNKLLHEIIPNSISNRTFEHHDFYLKDGKIGLIVGTFTVMGGYIIVEIDEPLVCSLNVQ